MASKGKGGHVRGLTLNQIAGLITVGALNLTGANGQAMLVTIAPSNPQAIGGQVWWWQSINGVGFSRVAVVQEATFAVYAAVAEGGLLTTGQVIRAYGEWRDSRGELLCTSNIAQRTVP